MTFRKFALMPALSLALLGSAVAADAAPRAEQAWITYALTPVQTQKQQEWHVRATEHVDVKMLNLVSAFVARSTELKVLLVSRTDADLTFRTDQFLVTRFAGNEVTLTAGPRFPISATESLAKRFRAMGYAVKTVAPGVLLQEHHASDPAAPQFVVPHGTASPK